MVDYQALHGLETSLSNSCTSYLSSATTTSLPIFFFGDIFNGFWNMY